MSVFLTYETPSVSHMDGAQHDEGPHHLISKDNGPHKKWLANCPTPFAKFNFKQGLHKLD